MTSDQGPWWRLPKLVVAQLSNIGIQLNFTSISVVLLLLDEIFGETPDWAESLLTSVVFAGAVAGMLALGYLGDAIGRHKAMALTQLIIAFSVLASAFVDISPYSDGIYLSVVFWRFFVGFGIGGLYPLSGSHAIEDETAGSNKLQRVGWSVFWQQPGQCLVYVLALILLAIFGDSLYRVQFRLMLAFGAVPSLFILPGVIVDARTAKPEPSAFANVSELMQLLREPAIFRALVGASLTWLFFDIYVYGIAIYGPIIIDKLFGSSETLVANDLENLCSVAVTVPTAALSVWLLGRVRIKTLQIAGFVIAAITLLVMGLMWHNVEDKTILFLTFLMMKLLTFVGVPTTSFVMPNALFPRQIRSSCTGIAAAAGKIGACVGTFSFPYVYSYIGMAFVFYMCSLCAVVGVVLTVWLIPDRPVTLSATGAAHPASKPDEETDTLLPKHTRDT